MKRYCVRDDYQWLQCFLTKRRAKKYANKRRKEGKSGIRIVVRKHLP